MKRYALYLSAIVFSMAFAACGTADDSASSSASKLDALAVAGGSAGKSSAGTGGAAAGTGGSSAAASTDTQTATSTSTSDKADAGTAPSDPAASCAFDGQLATWVKDACVIPSTSQFGKPVCASSASGFSLVCQTVIIPTADAGTAASPDAKTAVAADASTDAPTAVAPIVTAYCSYEGMIAKVSSMECYDGGVRGGPVCFYAKETNSYVVKCVAGVIVAVPDAGAAIQPDAQAPADALVKADAAPAVLADAQAAPSDAQAPADAQPTVLADAQAPADAVPAVLSDAKPACTNGEARACASAEPTHTVFCAGGQWQYCAADHLDAGTADALAAIDSTPAPDATPMGADAYVPTACSAEGQVTRVTLAGCDGFAVQYCRAGLLSAPTCVHANWSGPAIMDCQKDADGKYIFTLIGVPNGNPALQGLQGLDGALYHPEWGQPTSVCLAGEHNSWLNGVAPATGECDSSQWQSLGSTRRFIVAKSLLNAVVNVVGYGSTQPRWGDEDPYSSSNFPIMPAGLCRIFAAESTGNPQDSGRGHGLIVTANQ